ncbi:MAG: 3-dehydroquinate synthase [Anaerolineae bacterium CG2_30_64_16]|nr:MAG: 3-dehydroquinate synthase [Anaerolineae bacterium CG2_30_64_16]
MSGFNKARELLDGFKGDRYLHGVDILARVGPVAAKLGARAALVADQFPGSAPFVQEVQDSLHAAGITTVGMVSGAAPNAPREDLARIRAEITALDPDLIVSFGGGSTIDAVKAAELLRTLGGEIEQYFGAGLVTKALAESGKTLTPHVAIQTAASSGAHLTKYSNITDVQSGQKKLIVDEAIVPALSVFDYKVTFAAPRSLTADGALDGIAHMLEVLYGLAGKPAYDRIAEIARVGIDLVVRYLPVALREPANAEAREALGLATDLGGYAIMIGGTNGGHLTSFSLVDVLSHGRACAIMNPYYTVFFAPAIQKPLQLIGGIFRAAGYTQADVAALSGRKLGVAVAEAMIAFEKAIGFPATLAEVPAFTDAHISKALAAAKDPQLRMKLENMPAPLTANMIDAYMGPILRAAQTGDLGLIRLAPTV